jgi:DNA/RNA-binding domain of Phe-tRNA-synthetase-like protein
LSIFFSLKYFLPILTFDADRIEEPLSLAKHETGHIEWQDDAGLKELFSHASKAQISQDTKNILQIILFPPSISREKSKALIQSLTKMFVQIHGGESKYELIEKAL